MSDGFQIDLFQKFELEEPISGLIFRITDKKGIRIPIKDSDEGFSYSLRTELTQIYNGEACELIPGIYTVLDICKPDGYPIWNHYLFIVEEDGTVYPVGEYLDRTDSVWVKEALQVVKKFFNGEDVKKLRLTRYEKDKKDSSGWSKVRK